MASICTRCALRLSKARLSINEVQQLRSLSSTTSSHNKVLPAFQPASNPEIDAILSDFRHKHFLPTHLAKPQWNLVFREKNRNILQENPQAVNVGGEEFQLEHLGGYGMMPNRKKQLSRLLELLRKGEPSDWQNLQPLLRGLHAMGKDPPPRLRAKIIRLAIKQDQFQVVIQCLNAAQHTGLTLSDPETLHAVVWGMRQVAERGEWSEEALAQAIKMSNSIAVQLESSEHNKVRAEGGRMDPRRDPFVIGQFLELSAVYAWRFKGKGDVEAVEKVRVLADRLLSNMSMKTQVGETVPNKGPIMPMRLYAPILHGLYLAQKMLGDSMPQVEKAREIVRKYAEDLRHVRERCGEAVTGTEADPDRTYREEAIRVWDNFQRIEREDGKGFA